MPLSLTHSIFTLCAFASVAAAAAALVRALRPTAADRRAARKHAERGTELVWALVPVAILGLVLASILSGGHG